MHRRMPNGTSGGGEHGGSEPASFPIANGAASDLIGREELDDALELFFAEPERESRGGFLYLFGIAATDDGRGDRRMVERPGHGKCFQCSACVRLRPRP